MKTQSIRTSRPVKDDAYYTRSNENLRNIGAMIAEMEAGGRKVLRRDPWGATGAVLVTPEIVHMRAEDEDYYPNAVRLLYEMWKAESQENAGEDEAESQENAGEDVR